MSQRGFTLIEMAMVFVLVGLLVGGGLFALAPILDKTRLNQTNATLDQVESSLVLFVIRNQRLPCPADGSNTASGTGAGSYGMEQYPGSPANGGTTFTGGDCSVGFANAVIPWKTLGLDEAYSMDAWGNRISYYAAQTGKVSAAPPNSITTGTTLKRATSTYPTGPFMTVTDVTTAKAVTPPNTTGAVNQYDQAAYVLISHGRSGWYGWNKSGIQNVVPLTDNSKACNNNPTSCAIAANSYVSGGPVGNPGQKTTTYFDDIVRWRSPATIIQLCGSGSCGNP